MNIDPYHEMEPLRNPESIERESQPAREAHVNWSTAPGDSRKADQWDYLAAAASGTLTAAMDIVWMKELSLEDAHSWGTEQIRKFVVAAAEHHGGKKDDLVSAITCLEDQFPIDADKLTGTFGGGRQHHLRDFVHHPTPIGLLFSIISQFTGKGYGTDVNGNFVSSSVIPGWKKPDLLTGLYQGSVVWALHMVSDMAGSSSSVRQNKEGTGLPGPLLSFFKELSSMPGLRALTGQNEKGRYQFSLTCSELFNGTLLGEHDENGKLIKAGTKFDLRTELGLAHESLATGQALPVLLNEAIVCAFYSVSRLIRQLNLHPVSDVQNLKTLDFSAFLPWNSPALRDMRTLAASTFSVLEIASAGVQAYVHNRGHRSAVAAEFIQRINYVGVIRLTAAVSAETCGALSHLYDRFEWMAERQKAKLTAAVPDAAEKINITKKAVTAAGAIGAIGTPVGFLSAVIGVYDELGQAAQELQLAREDRVRLEAECRMQAQIIRENRQYMEGAVEQYMQERLRAFSKGLSDMEQAWDNGNTDLFLTGNAAIQEKLGNHNGFASQAEFDDLMGSDLAIKL